jgi:putative transposase
MATQPKRALRRHGPKKEWGDAALLERILVLLAESLFYDEGHRKVWTRLRFQQARTSKAGVLRLTRDPQLLAPFRTHYSFYYNATLTPAGF